jgi:hypothetical protein
MTLVGPEFQMMHMNIRFTFHLEDQVINFLIHLIEASKGRNEMRKLEFEKFVRSEKEINANQNHTIDLQIPQTSARISGTRMEKVAAEMTHISGKQLNAALARMGFHKLLHVQKMLFETSIVEDTPSS